MKRNRNFYAFIATALLTCLCLLPARHYASRAYSLWLSQEVPNVQQAQLAARYNHIWATGAVAFGLAAVAFLIASLGRSGGRRLDQAA